MANEEVYFVFWGLHKRPYLYIIDLILSMKRSTFFYKGSNSKGGSMRFEIEHKYDTEIIFICLALRIIA